MDCSNGKHPISSSSAAITEHYDCKKQRSLKEREASPIIRLRSFNNWVKAVLINEFVPSPGARVVDFCCGKGGDLRKWEMARLSYLFGADISSVSIEQCKERQRDLRLPFPCQFSAVDCFSVSSSFANTVQLERLFKCDSTWRRRRIPIENF